MYAARAVAALALLGLATTGCSTLLNPDPRQTNLSTAIGVCGDNPRITLSPRGTELTAWGIDQPGEFRALSCYLNKLDTPQRIKDRLNSSETEDVVYRAEDGTFVYRWTISTGRGLDLSVAEK